MIGNGHIDDDDDEEGTGQVHNYEDDKHLLLHDGQRGILLVQHGAPLVEVITRQDKRGGLIIYIYLSGVES